jgi:DNA-binding transcriptional MerR regulator
LVTRSNAVSNKVYATGQVAKKTGLRRYQIDYLLETGRVPEPKTRAANKRLWSEEEIALVKRFVEEREARKARRGSP